MATDILVSELERLYKVSAGKPEIVRVPQTSFVMIDGHGDPNTSQDYKDAIEASMHSPTRSSSLSRTSRGSTIGWVLWRVSGGPRT
jgi:hypothetical protein